MDVEGSIEASREAKQLGPGWVRVRKITGCLFSRYTCYHTTPHYTPYKSTAMSDVKEDGFKVSSTAVSMNDNVLIKHRLAKS